jgi:alkylated DNA repair dioxygenase AlkB
MAIVAKAVAAAAAAMAIAAAPPATATAHSPRESEASGVPGLRVWRDFASDAEAAALLRRIDELPWSIALKRRTQHYGFRYDYTARSLPSEATAIPSDLAPLLERLVTCGLFESAPNQVIVNEYLPGQGVRAHVDEPRIFGPVVASLSLGAPVVMRFTRVDDGHSVAVDLPVNSLTILSGDARYKWRHAIAARRSDVVGGVARARRRRVSVTFRCALTAKRAREDDTPSAVAPSKNDEASEESGAEPSEPPGKRRSASG